MSFTAKYNGTCAVCSEPWYRDDQLEWNEGEVVHADCLPGQVRDKVSRPTCPRCNQVQAVNGTCGCDPE